MASNSDIIEKILSDANAQAAVLVAEADKAAAAVLASAKAESERITADAEKAVAAETEELMRRRLAVADLDVKRQTLGMRSAVMDSVYNEALKKLRAMPSEKYKSFVAKMIKRNADDGDVVVISKADKDILTAAWIAGIAKEMKISLSIGKEYGDFIGGVILQSAAIDKNLALEEELSAVKKEIEPLIAAVLFE